MNNQRSKGAILSYVVIFANTLVQLLYTPFLIRALGQSEYGLFSLVSSIIGYLTVLDLGFGNAIVVFTTKYHAQKRFDEERKLHGMFFVIYSVIGMIAVIAGLFLCSSVNTIFAQSMTELEIEKAKTMMVILVLNIGLTFLFSIYSSIIVAYEQFVFQKIMSLLSTLLKPVIMIPLLLFGFKSIAMCVVISLINVFILILNYLYCRYKLSVKIVFKGFDKALFVTIITYSFYVFLTVVVDKINWSVDNFILGAVSGTVAVSIYSIASQLTQLFINLSTAVSGVFLPKISAMVALKQEKRLTEEMIKIGRIQFLIIYLMATGLILVGDEFIVWWAGKAYKQSYYVAIVLILPACIPLIQNLGLSIMQAMNRYRFKGIMTSIIAIVNVVVSIFLAKKYGPIGAAMGTALAQIVGNIIIMNIYYVKKIGLNMFEFWRSIFNMGMPLLITTLIAGIVKKITNFTGITCVIVISFIYLLMYCFVSYRFSMNDYEKALIKKIIRNE